MLKVDRPVSAREIGESCGERATFVVDTTFPQMRCIYVAGQNPNRGTREGATLYRINWNWIHAKRDLTADPPSSCCEGCTSDDTLCKPGWRVKPVDYADPGVLDPEGSE